MTIKDFGEIKTVAYNTIRNVVSNANEKITFSGSYWLSGQIKEHATCFVFDSIDEIIKEEEKLQKSISVTTLPNKAKVFFGDTTFPATLFNALGTQHKRTIKDANADVIVMDECSVMLRPVNDRSVDNFYRLSVDYHFIAVDANNNALALSGNSSWFSHGCMTEDLFKSAKGAVKSKYNLDLKIFLFPNKTIIDRYNYLANHSNCMSTTDFIKEIWKTCPTLSDDEFAQIKSMIKSPDKEMVNSAVKMLPYYNLSERIIDLYEAFRVAGSTLTTTIPTGVTAEYIWYVMETSRKGLLELHMHSVSSIIAMYIDMINKNPLCMCNKDDVLKIMRQQFINVLTSTNKDTLERLGITLNYSVNDQDGETKPGSGEVETK